MDKTSATTLRNLYCVFPYIMMFCKFKHISFFAKSFNKLLKDLILPWDHKILRVFGRL